MIATVPRMVVVGIEVLIVAFIIVILLLSKVLFLLRQAKQYRLFNELSPVIDFTGFSSIMYVLCLVLYEYFNKSHTI
ncbi:MAG: hypothetical protein CL868_20400 [Cytophagaceae bacterium]|nr:hypothetical protein [Cytophagaceae bacterium]|tara:strand:- start:145 stop:375 length:231 start_codon:yes stop_codon:yes gene_type:complete